MNESNHKPPRIFTYFLRRLCKEAIHEEMLGDLYEYYSELSAYPAWKRIPLFWFQVINFLRPFALKGLSIQNYSNMLMFSNYFKIAYRNLKKHPVNSTINLFGLAMAIGVCVFAYAYGNWTYSTDQFHVNKDKIFMITFFADREGEEKQYGMTPVELGLDMKKDFSQIDQMARVKLQNAIIKVDDNVFYENISLVDPDFMSMFTFPIKWGSANSLESVQSIVLSEQMAVKYFGNENPIGKELLVKFNENKKRSYIVGGVAEKIPTCHTLGFDFLVNYENIDFIEDTPQNNWENYAGATFIQLKDETKLDDVVSKMDKYQALQNASAKPGWEVNRYGFEVLRTLSYRSEFISNYITWSNWGDHKGVLYMSIVTILLMILACLNYVNISIVSATKRLKEIGIRKTIGAGRKLLITQFLVENIFMTTVALVIGVALGMTFFIPGFEGLWSFDMGFSLWDAKLLLFLPMILVITGLLSGLYPAIYISKFQAISIFRGTVKFGAKNRLTKVLLSVQLIISCILITSAVMFSQNTSFLSNRNWGYDPGQILFARLESPRNYEQLKNVMLKNPNVSQYAGSADHIGKSSTATVLQVGSKKFDVQELRVEGRYFKTMNLSMVAGKSFRDDYEGDRSTIVINQALANNLGFEDPVGEQVKIGTELYTINGIVADFHYHNFSIAVKPTILRMATHDDLRFLTITTTSESVFNVYDDLKKSWIDLFPEKPFNGGFQEDVWGYYFTEIGHHATVWQVFATIAILITVLGLYGLISLNVASRIREFSIRKVLGAGFKNLAKNISRQYYVYFGLSVLLGAPISYFAISTLITAAYTYHMPITPVGSIVAVLIIILILLFTTLYQVRKVYKSNSADGLKVE